MAMLDVQTKAEIFFEHRLLLIQEQTITLGGEVLFKLPARKFTICDIFDPTVHHYINNETLGPLLSQKLLSDLYRVPEVREFLDKHNIKIKKWEGVHW